MLSRPGERGLGSAYRDGFAHVLAADYDVVVTMDADLSHDPRAIPEFLETIVDGADLVIGSRYVTGGGTTDWPVRRQLLSKWGNAYTRTILGRVATRLHRRLPRLPGDVAAGDRPDLDRRRRATRS